MLVECVIINPGKFSEVENAHTATYINTYDIGNDLVAEVAGETYDAACAGVNVGHYAYLLVGEHINREQFPDLLQSAVLDVVSKYLHVISIYCFHILLFLLFDCKGIMYVRNHFAH